MVKQNLYIKTKFYKHQRKTLKRLEKEFFYKNFYGLYIKRNTYTDILHTDIIH